MTYTAKFTAGKADLPPGTFVTITAVSLQEEGVNLVNPNIVCHTQNSTNAQVSLAIPISTATAVTLEFLKKEVNWTCSFDVQVRDVHKAAGQIDSFEVTFYFTGNDVTDAYYVPTIKTHEVFVYTGNALSTPTYLVEDIEPDIFFTSESLY